MISQLVAWQGTCKWLHYLAAGTVGPDLHTWAQWVASRRSCPAAITPAFAASVESSPHFLDGHQFALFQGGWGYQKDGVQECKTRNMTHICTKKTSTSTFFFSEVCIYDSSKATIHMGSSGLDWLVSLVGKPLLSIHTSIMSSKDR